MINRLGGGRSLTAILLAGAAASVSAPVLAQAETVPAQQDTGLAEIVVTAQKRSQNLQDVGVSVTALSSTALKAVPTNDATQLASVVPSLQVNQYSPSLTVYNLRGVSQNDFSDHQEAPIAFYNDEVYIGALGALAGQTYDLERVEVLRGPQGTLFGRNATGGLVQAVTAKPTKSLDGYVTLTGGSYGQLATEGAISGPITDHIRARLAGTSDYHDGYYKSLNPAVKDGGNSKFYAFRGQIEADVGDRGKFRLKVEYMRNDHERANALTNVPAGVNSDGLGFALGNQDLYGTGPGATYSNPPSTANSNPFVSNSNRSGDFDRKYWNISAYYEQDLGFANFTSISNYQHLKKAYSEDTDGTPADLLSISAGQRLFQISQELRLAGKTDRLNWVVGLYGLKIKTEDVAGDLVDPAATEFNFFLPPGTLLGNSAYNLSQNTRSFAAFAQGEYKLTDIFSAIVGGRYSSDWKDYSYTHFSEGVEDYDFASRAPGLSKRHDQNWSGKVELDAKLDRNTLLYVSVNRGTKGGGFNAPNVIPTAATAADLPAALAIVDGKIPFKQEELTNYEGGFKLKLADNKVTFNGSAFRYVYKNYQAFTQLTGSQFIVNYPARVTGVELELSARPVPALNVNLFATHLFQATVKGVQLPGDGITPGRVVNTHMPQAPKWSVGGSLAYDVSVSDLGKVTFSTNWKYDTSMFFSVYNAPVEYQAPRAIGNVRVDFRQDDGPWELALFVNNVTNHYYKVFVSDNSFTTSAEAVYARPRWFGGSMTFHLKK